MPRRPGLGATTARIAVVTDVHANLPALDAALAEIDRAGADVVYHTGDAIGLGPFPAECLDRLLSRPSTHLLMGNHDAWFAFGLPDESLTWMAPDEREHQRWVHAQLDPALKPVVAAWPYASSLRIEGLRLDFLHYPLNDAGGFRSPQDLTPEVASALFQLPTSTLVFFGHDHRQWNITGGSTHFVNPGSLGCSEDPVARFVLVEVEAGGGWTVSFRSATYDPTPVFRALEDRRVPAREFIRRTFLPPIGDDGPRSA
jgi:predicted phosphodiesterase